jgi:hypothetical protein
MMEANSSFWAKAMGFFIGLPAHIQLIVILVVIDLLFISVWMLANGYTFVWNGQPYGILAPQKMTIRGSVHLNGRPEEDLTVRLDASKTAKTDTNGSFVFPNLDPNTAHNVEVVTDYGTVSRVFPGERGLVNLEVIEAAKNMALGKPVLYYHAKSGKLAEGTTRYEFSLTTPYNLEEYCIRKGHYPHNLTDGDEATMFYPGAFFFDVMIDLLDVYDVFELHLKWGNYGISKEYNYISEWRLFYAEKQPEKEGDWIELQGNDKPPGEQETIVNRKFRGRYVKLFAESKPFGEKDKEWIGMYEFKAYGKAVKGKSD